MNLVYTIFLRAVFATINQTKVSNCKSIVVHREIKITCLILTNRAREFCTVKVDEASLVLVACKSQW